MPVAVVTEERLGAAGAGRGRRPAQRTLGGELDRRGLIVGMILGLVVTPVVMVVAAGNPFGSIHPALVVALAVTALPLLLVPVILLVVHIDGRRRAGLLRARFLAVLLCPSCAHDLNGVPPREGGVTVCPECGAAWRMEGTEARSHEGTKGSGG